MTDNQSQSIFSNNSSLNASTAYSGDALSWLHALPDGKGHTDLVSLDSEFAIRCIHELVDFKSFELPLQVGHPSNEKLLHFYFEARNREKVFGTKNLALGYPFVLARVGGYEVAAPLFIWSFQLEPHAQNTDSWLAQRLDGKQITPNYPFFHLVDAYLGLDLSAKVQKMAESKSLTAQGLSDLCEELRRKLGLSEEGLPLSIQSLPTEADAARTIASGHLIWGAVAGIFPTLPRTTITQPPVVAPNLPANADNWGHLFSLLPLDPTQRAVLLAMQQNALTVVEGASGTGKTYLISALATNALANGKKCLVVSKSIHSLRRAQKFLLEKGFGDVSFILRDIQGDQLMLADMLRMAADNKNKVSYDEELFNAVLNKTLRIQDSLDESWMALHKPIFGDLHFSDTVGQFLRANRLVGKELLVSQLNPADFAFSKEEYDWIMAAIASSEPLFRRFPILQHPLVKLHHSVFLDYSGPSGLDWTQSQVRNLMAKATALHHQFINKTNDYGEALLDHYEQYYLHLQSQVSNIRNGLADGVLRYGSDFEKPASTAEKLYGVFSDRYKEIVAAKAVVSNDFEELLKIYAFRKYFEFDFPPQMDVRNIRKVSDLSKNFEIALQMWRKRIPSIVREDVRRLNVKSIHNELDYREEVRELEHSMDAFLDAFNDANLYEESLRHEMLTIPKRQEFLEVMIAQLEETQFYLRDFDDFYTWQNHWLGLKPAAQKVVRALCKIKPANWPAAFESWYLYHLLLKQFHPGLVWDQMTVQNMQLAGRELRNLLPMHISALWQARKAKALRQLKSSDSTAFKTWFGKANRTLSANKRPEMLFSEHIEPLTETLPVLLVTPEVALDVVQASKKKFDLVLVDEAHNISKQECYHLFELAERLVVFGDSKQDMTPFAQDDFLEFCKGIGAKAMHLDYQHFESPQEWVRFNKIAFDTPFKRLPSERSAREATSIMNVEGRYDEITRTNEAEARQIIDWLNLIEPTPAKTYPVVGIACSTVEQRDLIAAQLLRIRQRKLAGFEKIQQLHLNGLGVYQLAELQGQHVDILLLSMTHGPTDAHGSLSRDLHFWNSDLGINQLYIALTRASQKIYIAHSIPAGLYAVLAADKSFFGTCILSHLVTFADLIQRGESDAAEEQLQKMKELLGFKDTFYPVSQFMEEVEIALRSYFERGQMQFSGFAAGMRVPLYVDGKPKDEPSSILLFDGVLSKTAVPSYEWEAFLKNYFNRNNIEYVSVLSANWWKSPKQEARRLTSRMLRREP